MLLQYFYYPIISSINIHLDHVNIESQSRHDVINNSIINEFSNTTDSSIVLHCVTVRRHENATWQYDNGNGLNITNLNKTEYISTIRITGEGMGDLTCISKISGEHRTVYVTTGMCDGRSCINLIFFDLYTQKIPTYD